MNKNCNSSLEVSFDEIFENQNYHNSDNCQRLLEHHPDMIIIKNNKVIVFNIKRL